MMNFTPFVRLFLAVWLLGMVAACNTPAPYVTVDGAVLGTTFHIKAQTKIPQREIYASVMDLDAELKHSMSIFDERSLLSRINRGETDSLDSHLTYNILAADSVSRISDGMYDITVKPLVEAWGFAGKAGVGTPNLDSLLPLVGYRKIRIEQGRLVKADPRMQLDFNSIGKGYMVDLIARMLEARGVDNYLVTIAGSGRCRGVNEQGGKWRIGIETPYDNNFSDADLQRIVAISDISYATSGNYRRFYYTADGRKIAHTINPVTGQSAVSRLLSATVFCNNAARADALGTMFMSLGPERAVEKARELEQEGVMAYFILATDKADGRQADQNPADYEIWCSPRLEKLLNN